MIVLSSGKTLTLTNIPDDIRQPASVGTSLAMDLSTGRISEVEREVIRKMLTDVRGNKSLAAKKLGISRRTLYRKIDEYKL